MPTRSESLRGKLLLFCILREMVRNKWSSMNGNGSSAYVIRRVDATAISGVGVDPLNIEGSTRLVHCSIATLTFPPTYQTLAPNHTASSENKRRGGNGLIHATSKRVATIQS